MCALQESRNGVAGNSKTVKTGLYRLKEDGISKSFTGVKALDDVAFQGTPGEIHTTVDDVATKGGRFDYLVSAAAINPFMTWDETTLEDCDRIQEINLRGTWVVFQATCKQMIKEGHGGAIVTVSSIECGVSLGAGGFSLKERLHP
jgi:L-rhamnose 1-dehydrogenase